jgi:hypothetical protein
MLEVMFGVAMIMVIIITLGASLIFVAWLAGKLL